MLVQYRACYFGIIVYILNTLLELDPQCDCSREKDRKKKGVGYSVLSENFQ